MRTKRRRSNNINILNSVTVRLCEATYILGFDIDTTGFKNICPTHVCIQGLKTPLQDNNQEVKNKIKKKILFILI